MTSLLVEQRRAISDVRLLVRFRVGVLHRRHHRAAVAAALVMVALTVVAALVPALLPGAGESAQAREVTLLLPTGYVAVLAVSVLAATASGGGRELVPRDQAVALPVSPTTDHLGALLMAPLNIAWLIQSWGLLGVTAYSVGHQGAVGWLGLLAAQIPVLVWLATATSLAQAAAWGAEWVRRGAGGMWLVRAGAACGFVAMTWLVLTDRLVGLLDASPAVRITVASLAPGTGRWGVWATTVMGLLAAAGAAVAVGGVLASMTARRQARDELRVESSTHQARGNPRSELSAQMRVDRAGIRRSVPLRRGLVVLAAFPGLVALAGGLEWSAVTILPGLVASGGALLFGVNAWCLDGRGALWRESLPGSPGVAFSSRVLVLLEILLVATGFTLLLASLRAGSPTGAEVAAVLCCTAVVTVQVVAAALRWSVRRPFPSDMRSARATPAPPLVMVGYSARLALSTTVTALVFSTCARLSEWWVIVLVAVPFLLVSGHRLRRTSRSWADPVVRSRVVTTVAV